MKNFKISIVLFILLNIFNLNTSAQDNIMYNMRRLPQFHKDNVARQPDCKLYIGIPGISSAFVSAHHSGFTFKDVIVPDPIHTDSFMIDLDGIEAAMSEKNYLNTTAEFDILSFGFRLPNSYYFSFGISNKTNMNFQYPRSIVEIRNGNYREDGTPLDFTFGYDVTNYMETSFGLSKEFFNNMSVGMRVKLLSGMANVDARNIGVQWYTDLDYYDYTFKTDMLIRAATIESFPSVSNLSITSDSALTDYLDRMINVVDSSMTERANALSESRIGDAGLGQILLGRNFGLGFDFGYEYQINKYFNVSASINDIGFIKWKANTLQAQQNGEFKFTGLDAAEYISNYYEAENADVSLLSEALTDLTDSLTSYSATAIFSNDAYKTRLTSKLYAGATFSPVKWFDLGLLYRGTLYNKSLFSATTLSANTHFMRGWGFSMSYTIMDGLYNNIGAGLVTKFGPLQFYIMSDNIAPFYWAANDSPRAEEWIRNTKRITFHTGLNFTICGSKKDIPLLE